jgi:polar amino acid transport system substrate-binding protein
LPTGHKWLLAFSSIAAFLAAGSAFGAPPLRWGADAEGGAPYIFKDAQDPRRNIGFEVELIDALSKELGQTIEFHQYNFVSLLDGLQRGDFDFAMNGLEVTPDRIKQGRFRFSRPYYIYQLQLVARRDESRFQSLEELSKLRLRVGTLDNTAASRLLDQLSIAAKYYDGQAEPYQDLILGRLDAVLMDLPIAIHYAQPLPELKFVGQPVGEGHYAIVLRSDQEALASRFDAAILRLAQDGTLDHILRKWRIWTDDQVKLRSETPPPLPDLLHDKQQEWSLFNYFPLLLDSAWVTVKVSVLSMLVAIVIGLPISLARLYGPLPVQWGAIAYVEFFRGIPVLLLLYLLYYGLPSMLQHYGFGLESAPSDLTVAILAFGLNYAAYEAEIYRAGISSVPLGQWEAAASLGMSPSLTFRRIILPQAIRVMIPPMTNDFVALFKDTSLISAIAVVELTKQYQMLAKSSLKYLEVGFVTALLYLAMSVPLGHLARYLERKWGKAE